jgi:hypothetical protein
MIIEYQHGCDVMCYRIILPLFTALAKPLDLAWRYFLNMLGLSLFLPA